NLHNKSIYMQRDNRIFEEVKDRILVSAKNLEKEAKEWFESSCNVINRNWHQHGIIMRLINQLILMEVKISWAFLGF
ncbi:RNA-dependent RNA polymerase 2, partial [Olea europaea subsp. europaea]